MEPRPPSSVQSCEVADATPKAASTPKDIGARAHSVASRSDLESSDSRGSYCSSPLADTGMTLGDQNSVPYSVPDSALGSIPGSVPDSVLDSVLASVSDSGSGSVPDSAPDSVPESVPGSASDSVPDSAPALGSVPDSVSDSVTDSAPDSKPDRDCRRLQPDGPQRAGLPGGEQGGPWPLDQADGGEYDCSGSTSEDEEEEAVDPRVAVRDS